MSDKQTAAMLDKKLDEKTAPSLRRYFVQPRRGSHDALVQRHFAALVAAEQGGGIG